MDEQVETVVIGGGHSGLAMSYYLSQLGRGGKIMIKSAIIFSLLMSFSAEFVVASKLAPREFESLKGNSTYVLLGVVQNVELIEDRGINGKTYEVRVKVKSFLKGEVSIRSFVLKSNIGGVKGFDRRLEKGDMGVFFLKSLEGENGNFTHWGSVALFDRKYFK